MLIDSASGLGNSPSSADIVVGTVLHRTALACSDRTVLMDGWGQNGRRLSSEFSAAACKCPFLSTRI